MRYRTKMVFHGTRVSVASFKPRTDRKHYKLLVIYDRTFLQISVCLALKDLIPKDIKKTILVISYNFTT